VNQEKAPFSSLAPVYDAIFADVEYDDWADFSLEVLSELGWLEPGAGVTLLDLACGTGSSSVPYIQRGFVVSGVDYSLDMLSVARVKLPNTDFYHQNFLELNIPKRFQMITCVFDSLNNLLEIPDLEATLTRVKAHLEPNGVFVFDCNSPLGVTELWEDNEFAGEVQLESGSAHYHWTHQTKWRITGLNKDDQIGAADYHWTQQMPAETLGEVTAHIWIMDDQGAVQEEFHEVHLERGYTPAQLEAALLKAGFLETRFIEYPDGAEVTDQTPRFWGFARV
jgi:SAM-dependent methyltransferase